MIELTGSDQPVFWSDMMNEHKGDVVGSTIAYCNNLNHMHFIYKSHHNLGSSRTPTGVSLFAWVKVARPIRKVKYCGKRKQSAAMSAQNNQWTAMSAVCSSNVRGRPLY